ncbi:uncharacterized protein BDZ99DRAFT_514040 [Mytilinidion resinicola]|uniref:Uncharacterized protein n=1 Tax=Mytilinidion resinicola TaxID=574789 RepID=A0A6A6ZAU4_9PEZI|nr:uncharacterized protein BDZ99DRAFT_514040 [Mytilinidion resinicola]KAF2817823.1 hypothetical protein BDZ99DRAFT_514040 [Mytilinidion resinicola]
MRTARMQTEAFKPSKLLLAKSPEQPVRKEEHQQQTVFVDKQAEEACIVFLHQGNQHSEVAGEAPSRLSIATLARSRRDEGFNADFSYKAVGSWKTSKKTILTPRKIVATTKHPETNMKLDLTKASGIEDTQGVHASIMAQSYTAEPNSRIIAVSDDGHKIDEEQAKRTKPQQRPHPRRSHRRRHRRLQRGWLRRNAVWTDFNQKGLPMDISLHAAPQDDPLARRLHSDCHEAARTSPLRTSSWVNSSLTKLEETSTRSSTGFEVSSSSSSTLDPQIFNAIMQRHSTQHLGVECSHVNTVKDIDQRSQSAHKSRDTTSVYRRNWDTAGAVKLETARNILEQPTHLRQLKLPPRDTTYYPTSYACSALGLRND